ncbi:MAG TPA: hypothetical protein VIX12_03180, partial [Candidatus Binataceae bacterium]
MSEIETSIRALASARRLPQAHLERWLGFEPDGKAAFLAIAQSLHLRTGPIISALEMLEEISVREGQPEAAILGGPGVKRIVQGPGSAPERAHAFLEELRSIRYPQLTRLARRIEAEIAALKLPRGITIVMPKDLNSGEFTIELRARSAQELETFVET